MNPVEVWRGNNRHSQNKNLRSVFSPFLPAVKEAGTTPTEGGGRAPGGRPPGTGGSAPGTGGSRG